MAGDHDGHDLLAIGREVVRVAPEFSREPIAALGEGMDSLAVPVTETLQRARVDAFPLLDGAVR